MAGPWDRAYGYDMNRYVSLMALWFWVLIGKDKSSMIKYVRTASSPIQIHIHTLTIDIISHK